MIQLLITWFYITIISSLIGFYFVNKLISFFNLKSNFFFNFWLYPIFGILVITIIGAWVSIFFPVGLITNIIIIIFSLYITIFFSKKFISSLKKNLSIFDYVSIFFVFIILIYTISKSLQGPLPNVDSRWYHFQAIKWNEEFKVTKGIGNLISTLGYNYHWSITQAIFSMSFLKFLNPIHSLNPLFLLWFSLFLITSFKNNNTLNYLFFIILFFLLNMNNTITSPTPDFIIASLTLFIGILILKSNFSFGINDINFIILIIILIIPTIKLSGIWLYIIIIFVLLKNIKWLFSSLKNLNLILIFLLIFIPYFYRNYIISGYLIYPLDKINIFNVNWKVPLSTVIVEKTNILNSGLKEAFLHLDFKSYFSHGYVQTTKFAELLVFNYLISILILLILIIYKLIKGKKITFKNLILWSFILFSFIFWVFQTPDPRFNFGGIIFTISYIFFTLIRNFFYVKKYKFFKIKNLIFILFSFLLIYKTFPQYKNLKENIIYFIGYEKSPIKIILKNNIKYNIALEHKCFYTDLPCLNYEEQINKINTKKEGNNFEYFYIED